MRPPKRSVQMPSGTRASEPDRTGRCRDQAEFGIGETELGLQRNAENREHHPDREADGESEGARPQHAPGARVGGRCVVDGWLAWDLRAAVMVLACRLSLRLVGNRLQD